MTETHNEPIFELKRAFATFSKESARLEAIYQLLQERYRTTNAKLEEKVHELNIATNYLASILNSMREGLIFVDTSGKITTFNRAAERILGVLAASCLYKQFDQIFTHQPLAACVSRALACRENPSLAVIHYLRKDGPQIELEVSATLSKYPGHEGLILLLRDVTRLHRLQRIASHQSRLHELGEMAAAVAHEIRNPLGGIKGFASLLERDLKDRPPLAQMARSIGEGVSTLDQLVCQVLNYAKPMELTLSMTPLIPLFEEIRQLILMDERQRHVRITIEGARSLSILIDRQRMKAVLLNLAVNAIQAMPQGGTLTFSAFARPGEVTIRVSDTGIGIPPENLQKIFSPFFTTKIRGNGFGLAEVYKAVQAHGGSIEVSSSVGQGSAFTLRLR